ncbi:MAG: guanylate kinase [Caldisericia bacterium]|nr:guanylate kinase [Caldisericia bacterium]
MSRGTLFILSGPSGVGKTTVEENIVGIEDIFVSISETTRAKRENEQDGLDYKFISTTEFQKRVSKECYLEWANVHGNFYGTPIESINQRIQKGLNALLVIDVQGTKQVRDKIPSSILIFLLPPTMDELRKRLVERSTDQESVIEKRLQKAREEITYSLIYDYSVVNHNITQATKDVVQIIRNCKSRRTHDK